MLAKVDEGNFCREHDEQPCGCEIYTTYFVHSTRGSVCSVCLEVCRDDGVLH